MDIMEDHDIKVVLSTPTAAPPIWLARKYPDILPLDERGLVKHEGTRRAVCFNNDTFWNAARQLVEKMARALGNHPQLIAWQIDSGIGGHYTESSFNKDSRLEWQSWLKLKYENVERLNERLGLRHSGQVVSSFEEVPMPMYAPGTHNPALQLDWNRFCSDAIVAFVRMQAEVLRELCPNCPVTVNLRALLRKFDHFDMAETVDFVSVVSNAAIKTKSAELACDIDFLRSIKKQNIRTPDGDVGFWVIEQKAGQVNWQDVNSLVRPGVIRLFTYQLISRGACGVLYYHWRQSRVGNEKFFGAVLSHHIEGNTRVYREISQIGEELKLLAPAIKDTKVVPQTLHPLHPRQRVGVATADAAKQILQPARAHPAHLQRAARPEHSRWISRARRRICRNTNWSSPRRCICCPPARPTASNFTSRTAARSSARSTPAWWTNTVSRPTLAIPAT